MQKKLPKGKVTNAATGFNRIKKKEKGGGGRGGSGGSPSIGMLNGGGVEPKQGAATGRAGRKGGELRAAHSRR